MPEAFRRGPLRSVDRWRRLSSALRPAALFSLLAGEALFLGLRFDAEALSMSASTALRALARVLGSASGFAVTAFAASWLLGRQRWSQDLAVLRTKGVPRAFPLRLLIQAASFAALYLASGRLFESVRSVGAWQVAAWMGALLATVASWLALWAPWPVLRPWLWRIVPLTAGSFVLASMAYAGGKLSQQLWSPLRTWTFSLVVPLTRTLVPGVAVDARKCVIGTGDFAVAIAADCSGYEGLGLTLVFLLAFFWLFRDRLRFPRSFLLLAVALPCIWLLNAVRIATLVVVGVHVSPTLALGSFHSYIGSLLFAAANLAIMLIVLRTPMFLRATSPHDELPSGGVSDLAENMAQSHLFPFLALVAATLVCTTFSTEPALWYPVRILAATAALVVYRASVVRFLMRDRGPLPLSDDRRSGADSRSGALAWAGLVAVLTACAWLSLAAMQRTSVSTKDVVPAFAGTSWAHLARGAWWSFRILGAVVVVPLAEELAFRGFVMRRLTSPDPERVAWPHVPNRALILQAILFGVLHPHHMLGGVLSGAGFGWLARRTRCGYAPVLAHALTNALVLAAAAATARWDWL